MIEWWQLDTILLLHRINDDVKLVVRVEASQIRNRKELTSIV
jgi:hypothetical protein